MRSKHGCHSNTHSTLRYSSDTLQTWMSSWYSFRFNFQIQFRYAPDTNAILILIQNQLSDTVQIRSRHGCHPDTHPNSNSDTIQIRSRHECHSNTHSDSTLKCSKDTLQTRIPFWYLIKAYSRYSTDTLQIRTLF